MVLEKEQLSQANEENNNSLLNKLIKIIALTPPEDFFDVLVKGIAETLQVPYVFISEFLAEEHKVVLLSLYSQGKLSNDSKLPLKNTPCEHVIGKTAKIYPQNLRQLFPKDLDLVKWEAESYLGVPFFNTKKEPIGHFAILDTKPLENTEFARTVLETCSMRVAAELERAISDRLLRESEQQLRLAQDAGKIGSYHFTLETGRLIWSNELKNIFGVTQTPTQEQYWQMIHPYDVARHRNDSIKLSSEGKSFTSEIQIIKNGECCYILASGKAVFDKNGKVIAVVGTAQDITERKQAEEKIHHLANYDSVTGLLNRNYLEQHLQHSIMLAERQSTSFSLMYLDLDRFKDINDTLGHQIGDQLLKKLGRRLKFCLRKSDIIARIGGDEFACVLHNTDSKNAAKLAQKLLFELELTFYIEGYTISVGVSIGIASYPSDSKSLKDLLKYADIAMYRAKTSQKSNYVCFRKEDSKRVKERFFIEHELIKGLEQEEFSLYYQPRFNLSDNSIDSLEALLRWKHPERGYISPAEFIPVAEDVGIIHDLGKWVLNKACHQLQTWQQEGLFVRVAVNLSAKELQRDDIVEQVQAALISHQLEGKVLELEVTETAAMSDQTHSFDVLKALKSLGVYLAIDDFGTGYSSLSHLKRLPVDYLKVDRSFIGGISSLEDTKENIDVGIVLMILNLAKSLNLVTVAEGVETAPQNDFLQHHGCDSVQGYLYSRPLPVTEIEKFCRAIRGKDLITT